MSVIYIKRFTAKLLKFKPQEYCINKLTSNKFTWSHVFIKYAKISYLTAIRRPLFLSALNFPNLTYPLGLGDTELFGHF